MVSAVFALYFSHFTVKKLNLRELKSLIQVTEHRQFLVTRPSGVASTCHRQVFFRAFILIGFKRDIILYKTLRVFLCSSTMVYVCRTHLKTEMQCIVLPSYNPVYYAYFFLQ